MKKKASRLFDEINISIQPLLEKEPDILAVYLLGSALYGSLRPDSDIDIGLMMKPGHKLSSLLKANISCDLSFELKRTVDVGQISSNNLIYAREALLKGKLIYTKNEAETNLYRANLLGMYIQFNMDRQEVVNAYST